MPRSRTANLWPALAVLACLCLVILHASSHAAENPPQADGGTPPPLDAGTPAAASPLSQASTDAGTPVRCDTLPICEGLEGHVPLVGETDRVPFCVMFDGDEREVLLGKKGTVSPTGIRTSQLTRIARGRHTVTLSTSTTEIKPASDLAAPAFKQIFVASMRGCRVLFQKR